MKGLSAFFVGSAALMILGGAGLARGAENERSINFTNQIVPIFTKLSCNSGGCHGKASGQNGFKLSLLGFEPDVDYTALVKEGRGRRLVPAAPEHSLLLLKATGQMAHGGGKRLEADSEEYQLIRRWIATGMPFGKPTDPVITSIAMDPPEKVLPRGGKVQLKVTAHFSDGHTEDVTGMTQYESNDTEIATVDGKALVSCFNMSGAAAIMAQYQGQVATFRATVPTGIPAVAYDFPHQTVVDAPVHERRKQLGLTPSPLCSDEQFLRRATLEITGSLPTPAQVESFFQDKSPKKRDRLVDRLVDSVDYSYFFANKWADVLRLKRRGQPDRVYGTFAFHQWIQSAMAEDKPYDVFARDLLTATGTEETDPTVVWYKELQSPESFVDDIGQVFLGLRLACAQCHHHPYEKWGQDDYWGLAAFFGRVGRKNTRIPGGLNGQPLLVASLFNQPQGGVTNKRTNRRAEYKPLDTPAMTIAADVDPRQKLADWLTAPKNPYFARAVVNRYWGHFFGRGIVDPIDDMRVTNPPSNPELLDELAKDFVANGYSLKHLVRTICKSRAYQLSSVPNESNKQDKQSFARYYPKRLSAECLFDAVCQVTGSPADFNDMPHDQHALRKAIMLPDESYTSYFLEVFGRPQRSSACECERVSEANLAQALHLLNSDEIQNKLSRASGRAELLAKDPRPEEQKIEELFLWVYGRKPTVEQSNVALAHLAKEGANKKAAYENILWALLNTKEFAFIQ